MQIVAVDVGLRGCIVVLDVNSLAVKFIDMPVITYTTATGSKRNLLDEARLVSVLRSLAGPQVACVVVERQQAFHKGGTSSTFKLGYGYGLIIGTIRSLPALAVSLEVVKPRDWKSALGLVRGEDETLRAFKEQSRELALRLFPSAADHLKRKKDEGRAEALLIAEWARRHVLHKYIPGYRWAKEMPQSEAIASLFGEEIRRTATI